MYCGKKDTPCTPQSWIWRSFILGNVYALLRSLILVQHDKGPRGTLHQRPKNLLAARSARQQAAVSFRKNETSVSYVYTRIYWTNDVIADKAILIQELLLCVHVSDIGYADRREPLVD